MDGGPGLTPKRRRVLQQVPHFAHRCRRGGKPWRPAFIALFTHLPRRGPNQDGRRLRPAVKRHRLDALAMQIGHLPVHINSQIAPRIAPSEAITELLQEPRQRPRHLVNLANIHSVRHGDCLPTLAAQNRRCPAWQNLKNQRNSRTQVLCRTVLGQHPCFCSCQESKHFF